MTIKIDDYAGIDPQVAEKEGVELEYPSKFGKFYIRAKFASNENVVFQRALTEHLAKYKADDDTLTEYRDIVGLWFDTVIISWATDVQSNGKPVKPTRENFIDLMAMYPFRSVFAALRQDSSDWQKFVSDMDDEIVDEAVKN